MYGCTHHCMTDCTGGVPSHTAVYRYCRRSYSGPAQAVLRLQSTLPCIYY
jgi:hypothetical protein